MRGVNECIKAHAGAVRSVDFSFNGDLLLSAGDDKCVKLWGLPSRRFWKSLQGHANWVRSASFSPDGTQIVSASDDKTVKLWDVDTGEGSRAIPSARLYSASTS